MNADRLLAYYEQVADAPDAIARLRRFILDLAVRGRLVPQDAKDEPAAELLKRSKKEKARLLKAGKSRDRIELPVLGADKAPFDIPLTWKWIRFSNIADFSAGRTPSRHDPSFWNTGDYAWISIADMEHGQVLSETKETVSERAKKCVFGSKPEEPGTIIMSFKLTIGKIARLGAPAFHNEAIISIRPHVAELDEYLFRILPQFARQGNTKGAIKGATLNRESISNILLPLPPLDEQHRIVAKVDELMSLCDRLEAARASREATRDRLASASLARLKAPNPKTFEMDARLVLDALSALTTRPDQIKALRQTILNLAVSGKLVLQDAKDEPASELLRKFAKTRAGERKGRDWSKGENQTRQQTFDLPMGWIWTTIDNTAHRVTVGYVGPMKDQYVDKGIPFLRSQNVRANSFRPDGLTFIDPAFHQKIIKSALEPGDVVVVRSGNVGTACVIPANLPVANCSDLVVVQKPECVISEFLCFYLNSLASIHVEAGSVGVALTHFNTKSVANMPIPLPPLAEQQRIVAKVDAMMALCDRLEASLTATAIARRRLLDVLLVEALAPSDDRTDAEIEWIADHAAVQPGNAVDMKRSALILTLAYERHRSARRDKSFGHVKAQKILHLVEAEADFDLGRAPFRDAAGPNDFHHMLNVEEWAQKHRHFEFEKNGSGYTFKPLSDYRNMLNAIAAIDSATRSRIEKIIDLLIPMDMEASELFATVYAAWNNLLIEGKNSEESDIVRAAREEWHPRKLRISSEKFVAALRYLRKSGLVPSGRGKFVPPAPQQDMFVEH